MAILIGVYRDQATAESVADSLHHTVADDVSIGDPTDVHDSVDAEMDAQLSQGWGSLAAFLTEEQARGALWFATGLGLAGAVLGLPLGLLYDAPAGLLVKLGIGALIGALFGATVGALLGGGFAMQSPAEEMAAERGVTVSCRRASPEAENIMRRFNPIRLDRMDRHQLLSTSATEGPSGLGETFDEFRRNTRAPERQG